MASPMLGGFIDLKFMHLGPQPGRGGDQSQALARISSQMLVPRPGVGRSFFAVAIIDRSAAVAEAVLRDCAKSPFLSELPLRLLSIAEPGRPPQVHCPAGHEDAGLAAQCLARRGIGGSHSPVRRQPAGRVRPRPASRHHAIRAGGDPGPVRRSRRARACRHSAHGGGHHGRVPGAPDDGRACRGPGYGSPDWRVSRDRGHDAAGPGRPRPRGDSPAVPGGPAAASSGTASTVPSGIRPWDRPPWQPAGSQPAQPAMPAGGDPAAAPASGDAPASPGRVPRFARRLIPDVRWRRAHATGEAGAPGPDPTRSGLAYLLLTGEPDSGDQAAWVRSRAMILEVDKKLAALPEVSCHVRVLSGNEDELRGEMRAAGQLTKRDVRGAVADLDFAGVLDEVRRIVNRDRSRWPALALPLGQPAVGHLRPGAAARRLQVGPGVPCPRTGGPGRMGCPEGRRTAPVRGGAHARRAGSRRDYETQADDVAALLGPALLNEVFA